MEEEKKAAPKAASPKRRRGIITACVCVVVVVAAAGEFLLDGVPYADELVCGKLLQHRWHLACQCSREGW